MKYLVLVLLLGHLSAIPIKVPDNRYIDHKNTRDLRGLEPFIGQISFRNICDHIIDHTTEWFDPDSVQQGDLIYLNLWFAEWFVEMVHDAIQHPYILVSGDVGGWIPSPEIKYFLYDPKLAAWFCRNMVFSYHPKFFQLPMGQDLYLFIQSSEVLDELFSSHEIKSQFSKEHLLYMNFYLREHGDRDKIYKFFEHKPYCYADPNTNQPRHVYYSKLASSKFTLSPLGLETDSVRTWEALVFDSIPIVEHTFLDPIYEGMPVLIVDDLTQIDELFLEGKYEELQGLSREKAYFPYWRRLIENTQQKVKNNDLAFTQLEATLFTDKEIETIDAIFANRTGPLIYKGFLSTLRPLQLSQYCNKPLDLYDPWMDETLHRYLCRQSGLISGISLFPSEESFRLKTLKEDPISVFLDLTYYRTSLKMHFITSTVSMGNFRHSLKLDLASLYHDLQPGSLLFGNMAKDPYVKKVLDLFAEENKVQIARTGSFWSLIKAKAPISSANSWSHDLSP